MSEGSKIESGDSVYCKFCGSAEVRAIKETALMEQGKSIHVSALQGLVGVSRTNGSNNQIEYDTTFCESCYKTNVSGDKAPFELPLKANPGRKVIFSLPYTLTQLLFLMDVNQNELAETLRNLLSKVANLFKKYDREGTNPCKRYKAGHRCVINIHGQKINIWLLLENSIDGYRFVRVIYGGGKSFCH